MENIFGITEEDLNNPDLATVTEFAIELSEEELMLVLNPEEREDWKDRIDTLAALPGLDVKTKIAAMLLGPESVLAQVFIVHGIIAGMKPFEALNAFAVYCELLKIPVPQVTSWISFMFLLGILETDSQDVTGDLMSNLQDVRLGPNAALLSDFSAPGLSALLESMESFRASIESKGIVFKEDINLLKDLAASKKDTVISVEDLAPDNLEEMPD